MKIETTNISHKWSGFEHGRLRCKSVIETFIHLTTTLPGSGRDSNTEIAVQVRDRNLHTTNRQNGCEALR